MSVTLGNIIVGSANFFEGDSSSLRDLGATSGGVTLAMGSNDFARVEIDQLRGVAAIEQTMRSFLVRTTIAEPTLTNLTAAYNMEESSVSSNVFSLTDTIRNTDGNRRVVFVGPAPSSKHRSFSADNYVAVGTPEYTHTRGEQTTLPLEFELIPTARTWSVTTLNVETELATNMVQVNSAYGQSDVTTIPVDKLIGGIISVTTGTGTDQSRAITDSSAITTGGVGTITVDPVFVTTPAAGATVSVEANRDGLWGTIRDVG